MAELTWPAREALLAMRADAYDRLVIEDFLSHWVHQLCAPDVRERRRGDAHLLKQGVPHFCDHLDRLQGTTLAERWSCFEPFWIAEVKGRKVTGRHLQTAVFLPAVVMRMVAPSMLFLRSYKPVNWIRGLLPAGAPLRGTVDELARAIDRLQNHVYPDEVKAGALHLCVKMLLATDSWTLRDIREADLIDVKRQTGGCTGADALDAVLCSAGVFARTPLRGIARSKRPKPGAAIEDYVGLFRVPAQFSGGDTPLCATLSCPRLGAIRDPAGEDSAARPVPDLHRRGLPHPALERRHPSRARQGVHSLPRGTGQGRCKARLDGRM